MMMEKRSEIYIDKPVDLIIFAGQSNMSGRGSKEHAVLCDKNAGFEYKAVSRPNELVPIEEPFGLNEDRCGGICDICDNGKTKRSGSLVSAAIDTYYKATGIITIAVSASVGGTSTEEWLSCYVSDAVSRLDSAKSFLNKNDIKIAHILLVWCQGESDGDNGVSDKKYIENTEKIFSIFQMHGVEKIFLIQTGHYNYISYPDKDHDKKYEVIRNAQIDLCEMNNDIILAGSFKNLIEYMKDPFHYDQEAYNEVGKNVGRIIAQWRAGIY